MNKTKVKTIRELEDERVAKEFCRKIIDAIKEFLKATKTTIADLCAYMNIDPSTFYRYEHGDTHIDAYRCKQAGTYFKHVMKEKHIICTPEMRKIASELSIFELD